MIDSHGTARYRLGRISVASLALAAALSVLSPREAAARAGCPEPPQTAAALDARSPYQAGSNAKSKDNAAFNEAANAGINGFIVNIERLADAAMGGDGGAAECFGTTMTKWVKTAPMTETLSGQATLQQQWFLSAIALATIKARAGGARLSPEVERWFRTVSDGVRAYQDARQFKNNLAAWAALAVGATAYLLRDDDGWRWAMGRQALMVDQIQPDGVLPKELARGPRASSYHVFAAMPLFATSLIQSCRGGVDAGQADRLQRLGGLLRSIQQDPQFLAARAGSEQFPAKAMPAVTALQGGGPENYFEDKLGGNITNLRQALSRCR